MSVPKDRGLMLLDRGWLTINGREAKVVSNEGLERGDRMCLRIMFTEPWPDRHP